MATILFGFLLCLSAPQPDTLKPFQQALTNVLALQTSMPPDAFGKDTCYCYTELLKVEIDKNSKVKSLIFSDSAPQWLLDYMGKKISALANRYKRLDTLASKAKLRSCVLVFPVVIEPDNFPCGMELKKTSLALNYFQFGKKNLRGNIIFGDPIEIIWPSRYIQKE